jgi:hypothetical protein
MENEDKILSNREINQLYADIVDSLPDSLIPTFYSGVEELRKTGKCTAKDIWNLIRH